MRTASDIFVSSLVTGRRDFADVSAKEFYISATGMFCARPHYFITHSLAELHRACLQSRSCARSINIYLPIVSRDAMHLRTL